jgi:UDP-2,4-diacetamido-2,4,6-trideoxy-beta-L-altropyranose hydrolase
VNIVFRVDGSTDIGLGHVMRCLALAKQVNEQHNIIFLCQDLPSQVTPMIAEAGVTLLLLRNDLSLVNFENTATGVLSPQIQRHHASKCWSVLVDVLDRNIDLLVVDHYALSAPFCSAMRNCCDNIVVIDDLANRSHDCDVLIDQNVYNEIDTRYEGLLPAHTRTLLGPKYAMLRKEFYQLPTAQRQDNHLIVCFGGSDPDNLTERAVDILLALSAEDYTADIVVGGAYAKVDTLREKLNDHPNMVLHHNISFLSQLMQRGSFMIGAGGTMHWERARSGIAGLIITLADNQIETTRCLDERRCCMWLGSSDTITDSQIRKAIEFALHSPQNIRDIADNARKLVGEHQSPSFVMDEILNTIKRNS